MHSGTYLLTLSPITLKASDSIAAHAYTLCAFSLISPFARDKTIAAYACFLVWSMCSQRQTQPMCKQLLETQIPHTY